PFYLLTKDVIGKETAALLMVAFMFPFIIASMYEKDGLPAEKYFYRFFLWKFVRPVKRLYKKENRFEGEERKKQMEMEVRELEKKQSEYRTARRKDVGGSKNRASGDKIGKYKASGKRKSELTDSGNKG
ncbi:MAG: PrgI family protein, partial [Lachnospiraceae bacterium]|nr:PrgI family protein [Lachnospiraceae bacterium]